MIKASILLAVSLLCVQCLADDSKPWMGTWQITQVICPFECVSFNDIYGDVWKTKKVVFKEKSVSTLASSCDSEHPPDWYAIEATTVGAHLKKWTDNEAANKKPKVKADLAKTLGLKPETPIKAGVVQCYRAEAFNLMYIDDKNAMMIGEENSFLRLKR